MLKQFLAISLFFQSGFACEDLYLELIKKCIQGSVYCDPPPVNDFNPDDPNLPLSIQLRLPHMQTLLTDSSLDTLKNCMKEIEKENIPGDYIETGVWRGGATIFMRAFLKVKGNTTRKVWVADSFSSFPMPQKVDETHLIPKNYPKIPYPISLEEVQANFNRYGLLDEQVIFLKGFFKDTLPHAPIENLSLLRLDGDLYESTMDALTYLYPKLSVGGYIIIDDCGVFPGCKQAVQDYLSKHNIKEDMFWEDWTGIYWKKTK